MVALERSQTPQTEVIARALQLVSEKDLRDRWKSVEEFDDQIIAAGSIDTLVAILSQQVTDGYAQLANPVLEVPPQILIDRDPKEFLQQVQTKETLIRELLSYKEYLYGLEISLLPSQILDRMEHQEKWSGTELFALADQVEMFFRHPEYQEDGSAIIWDSIGDRETFFRTCWEFFQNHEPAPIKGNFSWMMYAKLSDAEALFDVIEENEFDLDNGKLRSTTLKPDEIAQMRIFLKKLEKLNDDDPITVPVTFINFEAFREFVTYYLGR